MNSRIQVLFFIFVGLIVSDLNAQSFWFGPKAGVGIGTQMGTGAFSGAAFTGHFGMFVETYSEEEETPGALFAAIGLHQRGSSLRSFRSFNNVFVPTRSFIYNNISLQVGAKKFWSDKFYYMVGIRGEYTAFTNLEEANAGATALFYPINGYVIPFSAGIMGGAGYQFSLAELYGLAVELSVQPDLLNQYRSPRIDGVTNPNTGNSVTINAKEFRNTTVELTVYFRFLRKVIYY